MNLNCEIIAVGDEVLTGDIVNTNAREIAAGLEDAGVRVRRQTVTSDNPAEIRQTLTSMQTSFSSKIEFIPVRGCFSRGIFASAYLDCPVALDEIVKLYEDYYDDHNFTYVINRMPDLKDVVNTNKCLLYLTKEDGKLLIVSVIDNLLKGASGQAVHNMNLLFGLHERTGLNLKASAF